jgi:hypothetical protein
MRVPATIVAVEKQKIRHIVSLRVAFVIQNAMRLRHIVISGLSPHYSIFPHYLKNGAIFGKTLMSTKCVF